MRTSSIVTLVIAITMGVVAALLARSWMQSQQHASADGATGTIVVAATPLGFGSTITEDKIAEIPWAAKTLPEGAFATKQQMFKDGRRVALTPIERGEPILRVKITAPGQRGSLSTLLDDGKRAVTVRVDDVRGVAGFILPGDQSRHRPYPDRSYRERAKLFGTHSPERQGDGGRPIGQPTARQSNRTRKGGHTGGNRRASTESSVGDQHRTTFFDLASARRGPCRGEPAHNRE